jgi:hypothetical protein
MQGLSCTCPRAAAAAAEAHGSQRCIQEVDQGCLRLLLLLLLLAAMRWLLVLLLVLVVLGLARRGSASSCWCCLCAKPEQVLQRESGGSCKCVSVQVHNVSAVCASKLVMHLPSAAAGAHDASAGCLDASCCADTCALASNTSAAGCVLSLLLRWIVCCWVSL